MSGEERPERHAQAAGETTRSVWTESMYADARPWPGIRVLVDRSLPLGRRSGVSYPDVWLAAVAPSAALWRWYGVHEARYAAFADRYERELGEPVRAAGLRRLHGLARGGPLVLQTAVTPIHLSHARVLARHLRAGRPAEEGGEGACWLGRVCPDCGRHCAARGVTTCPHCRAPMAE
ncbi:DUF488 domain-containing protein [Streptomyces noursei]|uniref:DUF488 domain-containing protein n=1 Tax=Streptomyces noursei TaxID=1971 RepID=UPI00045F0029|nr:DUF488 family protein [Streptomyces noursei]AIA01014.1 hypothetical protein DC74_488 [Streptomyces noursei]